MDTEQIQSLQPAAAAFLRRFRDYFGRRATFGYFELYVVGLMADFKRKSIEPIALMGGVAVRSLQEFLAFFKWDHERVWRHLRRDVMDHHGSDAAIGVIDGSAHPKSGDKTPGVQRQWCGQTGKIDNCVVGCHLLYTDNDPRNPFSCVVASDLFLPEAWVEDRDGGGGRCREAGIPDELTHRTKWRIALDQVQQVTGQGVRFAWLTFDEEYGSVADFWFGLDAQGQRGIGEVRPNFRCWVKKPACKSFRGEHASRKVAGLTQRSPAFTGQAWRTLKIKATTRGESIWQYKSARVHLVEYADENRTAPRPTDRQYWLIVARQPKTGEIKYFVSNADAAASMQEMMRAAFARWHVEKWFERAKQECGFGAFEVRTYTSLIRHWLCSVLAMYFLAAQTQRRRGEKSGDHLRAGGPGGQRVGVENLEPMLVVVG